MKTSCLLNFQNLFQIIKENFTKCTRKTSPSFGVAVATSSAKHICIKIFVERASLLTESRTLPQPPHLISQKKSARTEYKILFTDYAAPVLLPPQPLPFVGSSAEFKLLLTSHPSQGHNAPTYFPLASFPVDIQFHIAVINFL